MDRLNDEIQEKDMASKTKNLVSLGQHTHI